MQTSRRSLASLTSDRRRGLVREFVITFSSKVLYTCCRSLVDLRTSGVSPRRLDIFAPVPLLIQIPSLKMTFILLTYSLAYSLHKPSICKAPRPQTNVVRFDPHPRKPMPKSCTNDSVHTLRNANVWVSVNQHPEQFQAEIFLLCLKIIKIPVSR